MPAVHDPYAALRHRDYVLTLSGLVLASIGVAVQNTVAAYEIYTRIAADVRLSLAGSMAEDLIKDASQRQAAFYVGLVGLAQFFPILLLALPAGQLADRYSRKLLLQLSQGIMVVASVGLALLSWYQGPIPLYYVFLTLAGISRALSAPSRVALISQVVPVEHLPNAVTWNSSGWQVANVTGPALGGWLISVTGQFSIGYQISAVCSFILLFLLIPIRPRPITRTAQPRSLSALFAGVRFVWQTDLLLAAITMDLFAVLFGGVTALLPVFTEMLNVGPEWFGRLRAAPALGAVLMGLFLAHRPPMRHAGRTLLLSVAGFGAATIVFALSTNVYLSFAMLALTGAFDNISVVVRGTLMQLMTPDDMRGRVGAVNSVFISSSNELGEVESGLTAKAFGPVPSAVGGAICTILVVIFAAIHWPKLRQLGELRPPEPKTQTEAIAAEEVSEGAQDH